MQKSKRILTAKDTLEAMKRGHYVSKNGHQISIKRLQKEAEQNTTFYLGEELDELVADLSFSSNAYETQIEVTGETTTKAIRRLHADGEESIFCLNFASAKNPGGGFLNGAQAQEESIARVSGLYNCLLKASAYYDIHRKTKSCLYTDNMIYAPNVPLFKDKNGDGLEEPVPVTILTSPAVNTGVVKRNEPHNIPKILPYMEQRIEKVLALALKHQHPTLVLGAWGCGVFQNEPDDIAALFQEALEGKFKHQFKRIVFAIYSRNERFITPFKERFE